MEFDTLILHLSVIVFGSGSDLEQMRKEKWMFPKMEDAPFYDIWGQSIGKADMIDIAAWTNTIPDLIKKMKKNKKTKNKR